MPTNLEGKKILVTAGSTWVPVDKVRVITNIFGGNLGIKIAEICSEFGGSTTLLIGPGRAELPRETEKLKIIRFKYFDELLDLVKKELESDSYDAMIHSAAVSDYTPVEPYDGKVKSGIENLVIKLKPTVKIVDMVKKISPNIFLIMFKLEVGLNKDELIDVAKRSMKRPDADLIVANEYSDTGKDHRAYIIEKKGGVETCVGKEKIAAEILSKVSRYLNK